MSLREIWKRLAKRLRFQMLCIAVWQALLIAIVSVLVFQSTSFGPLDDKSVWIATIVRTAAFGGIISALGVAFVWQLSIFPENSMVSFLPSLAVVFGFFAIVAIVTRTDYSRFAFATSFAGALSYLFFDYLLRARHLIPKLALLPDGDLRTITNVSNASVELLTTQKIKFSDYNAVVADLHHDHTLAWEQFLLDAVLQGITVLDVKSAEEMLTGRVEVEHLAENSFGAVLPSSYYLRIKRILDLILAILILPVVVPLVAIFAVLIALMDGGNPFFVQERVGLRAKPFTMYKLRSMRNAPADVDFFTQKNDNRVTGIGKFIRKFRIDELPQIINVMRGDMSWIGPRPEPVAMVEKYSKDIPFYNYRHAVRPGISGWAQVKQGYVADSEGIKVKLQYDFFYIRNFSGWLDFLIVAKTLFAVATGFKAH